MGIYIEGNFIAGQGRESSYYLEQSHKRTHVWIEEPTEQSECCTLAVRIEPADSAPSTIWFRMPSVRTPLLTTRADFAAVIALFSLMRKGAPATIHGTVAPSLLRNLEEFLAAWSAWCPDEFQQVEIDATDEREHAPASNKDVIAAFSRGVDAAYTAYRHQRGTVGRRRQAITRAIMIQGYDIPADDDAMFLPAFERAKQMTDDLQIELIPITTNYREIEPIWERVHLSCVAACLYLFAGSHCAALVGSSEPYNSLVLPWASNPITDSLLSSDHFRILHDGAEANRVEKLRLLSEWEAANENLMVCWEPTVDGRNCCRCNKCIRTILNYRVLGLPRPAAFAEDVTHAKIAAMRNLNETMVNDLEIILQAARQSGLQDSWIPPLEKVVNWFRLRRKLGTHPVIRRAKTVLKRTHAGESFLARLR